MTTPTPIEQLQATVVAMQADILRLQADVAALQASEQGRQRVFDWARQMGHVDRDPKPPSVEVAADHVSGSREAPGAGRPG